MDTAGIDKIEAMAGMSEIASPAGTVIREGAVHAAGH
jgi:hypothetical protein